MLHTYLDQLRQACEKSDIELVDAITGAGLPRSTFWRWSNNASVPTERAAQRVMDYICKSQ